MCFAYHHLYVFVQKLFTNGLRMGFPIWAKVKKTVHGVGTHWLSCHEKVLRAAVRKEGHADSLVEHKRCITIDFIEKVATVNTASYCQLLRQYFTLFIEWPSYIQMWISKSVRLKHLLNFCYHPGFSDSCLYLYCYFLNVSNDISSGLLQVFLVKLKSLNRTSNHVLYLIRWGCLLWFI